MALLQLSLWLIAVLAMHATVPSSAMGPIATADQQMQQSIPRQLTNTEIQSKLPTSPSQISTVPPSQKSTTTSQMPARVMVQPSSAVIVDTATGAKPSPDTKAMSRTEANLLQHLGWGLGRRGFNITHQQQATSLPPSPSRKALKDFWQHFFSLSWLLGHHRHPLHAQQSTTQQAQYSTAQQAQQSTAQQAQQNTAQQAQREATAAAQLSYDDVISSSPMPLARQEQVVAAHLIVKAAGSGNSVHYDLVKQTGQIGFPDAPTITHGAHQHTEGYQFQPETVMIINKKGSALPADDAQGDIGSRGDPKPLGGPPEKVQPHAVEWPAEQHMPMDDDTLTAQTSTSSQHQHKEAGVQQAHQAGPDQSSALLHRQSWGASTLPKPLSWREGNEQHPEVALNQAKQDFARWLSGAHAHPDYVEHMQQLAAASQEAAWPYTGHQSGAGMHPQDKELQQQAAADQDAAQPNASSQDSSDTHHVAAQLEHRASKSSTAVSADRHQGFQDSNGMNTRSLGNSVQQQAGLNAGTAAGVYKAYTDRNDKGDEIDQLQQQVVANSGIPAKTYVGYKDGNGFEYVDQMSVRQGLLQHVSLGS
ncbi:hypothetical protein WJX77_003171 [Trebouxia sp. C0004]